MAENSKEFEEKVNQIAHDIIVCSRNTLLVNLRFLDIALSVFQYAPSPLSGFATDGKRLVYNPMAVVLRYKKAKELVVRDYLHAVMHCIFCHMYTHTLVRQDAWDLACDIAVENAISELGLSCVTVPAETRRREQILKWKSKVKYMTAECLYRCFLDLQLSEEELAEIRKDFLADDHLLWYLPPWEIPLDGNSDSALEADGGWKKNQQEGETERLGNEPQQNGQPETDDEKQNRGDGSESDDGKQNGGDGSKEDGEKQSASCSDSRNCPNAPSADEQEWKKISNQIKEDLSTFSKQRGDQAGAMMQNLAELHREKYDYTAFLKKFAVPGEAMKIDDDEFDYIFYTYGLQLFDKMPLVEPLEYKEVKRIKEFVIAIDTSGSVSGPLVQSFLEKTYNILKQEESFFTKINLHIIQCDAEIQEDAKITSREAFDQYVKTMRLHGFGGTDFRPVFKYVDQLLRQREFVNLKGLIYFTDGYGTFPDRQPPYKTAFVFIDDGMNNLDVPVWAIKLILPEEEI